jgi:hypothetical protein
MRAKVRTRHRQHSEKGKTTDFRFGDLGRQEFYHLVRRMMDEPHNAPFSDKTWLHRLYFTLKDHFRKARLVD